MSAPTYELWLTNDAGIRLRSLDDAVWFSASRTVNRLGYLQMALPATFDTRILKKDQMVQVWRAPAGGHLSLWRPYFLTGWRLEHSGSREMITIYGTDPNELLRRRIVAFYAGEAESDYDNEYADDIMKDLVANAIVDSNPATVAGSRVWANLSVGGDLSDGPRLNKGCSFDPLLSSGGGGVLPSLADASKVAGTEVFFDIQTDTVTSTSISFVFRTYTGQPGRDVSDRVVFSQENGNLENPFVAYDYATEANYIYAAGQGEGVNRIVEQIYDAGRYNLSIWNRCEAHADARNQASTNSVRESGRALLEMSKPKVSAGGMPVDTAGTRFGLDWDFGDKVTMRYRHHEFACIIRAVVLRMDNTGRESIEARLDYES